MLINLILPVDRLLDGVHPGEVANEGVGGVEERHRWHSSLFEGLEEGLRSFLAGKGSDPRAEFYLPVAVSDLIRSGRASVEVLSCEETWFGITYREDRARVVAAIAGLVESGVYPANLFA